MKDKIKINKEDIITELLDDFLIKERTGGNPSIDEYVKKYPEYASDIKKVFKEEIDWMLKFENLAEVTKVNISEIELDTAWNSFYTQLLIVKYGKWLSRFLIIKRTTRLLTTNFFEKSKVILKTINITSHEIANTFVRVMSNLVFPIPKTVKVFIPSIVVAILILFLFSSSPSKYTNLAIIEKDPFIPILIKGFSESDKLLKEGMNFYKNGKYFEAIELLESYLDKDPEFESADVHFYLGLCYISTDRIAREKLPNSILYKKFNKFYYLLNNNINDAIEHFNKAIELGDISLAGKYYWYLGNAYLLRGDEKNALEVFRKVVETEGDFVWKAEKIIQKIEKN